MSMESNLFVVDDNGYKTDTDLRSCTTLFSSCKDTILFSRSCILHKHCTRFNNSFDTTLFIQTTATLRPHCKVSTWNGSLSCSTCRNSSTNADWKWPRGRPRQTWTRTVENDLKPANISLQFAHRVVASARSCWLEELSVDSNVPLEAWYWWG